MKIKKMLLMLTVLPVLLIAQPYSLNLQSGLSFNQVRAGSINCGSQINPINNCGFETGDFIGWMTTDLTNPFSAITVAAGGTTTGFGFFTSTPTEGSFTAFHGFDGNGPGIIEIAQDVTMPATAEQLTFDYRGAWDMTFGATVDRTFEVQIQPSGGGVALQTTTILTTAPVGSTVLDTGDLSGSVNVSAYAGQTVRIAFVWNVPENFTGPGQFQLDNVAVIGPPPMIPSLSFYGLSLTFVLLLLFGTKQLYRKPLN